MKKSKVYWILGITDILLIFISFKIAGWKGLMLASVAAVIYILHEICDRLVDISKKLSEK